MAWHDDEKRSPLKDLHIMHAIYIYRGNSDYNQ